MRCSLFLPYRRNSAQLYFSCGLSSKETPSDQGVCFPQEPNSAQCNGQGTFECGACTCHGKYYGKNCECDGSQQEGEDYTAACKR